MHRNLIFDIDSYNEIPKFLRDSVIRPDQIIRTSKLMEDTAMTNLDPNPTENPPAQTSAQTAEPTIDQLKKQREELERRIAEKQKAGRKDVIDQIVKVMRDFEVPLEDVAEALGGKIKRQGSKAKAKYRDPQSGAEWSGRGKPPVWIKGIEDRTPFEIR